MQLSRLEILKLKIQKYIGNVLYPIIGNLILIYLKYIKKYKIPDMHNIRKFYRSLLSTENPILICPNHLTMIDSVIIQWALASNYFYTFHFSKFPWNIPAKENVANNLLFRLIVYFTKCILIERKGTLEHKKLVLKKLEYLLQHKEPVLIFIEGTRSPTGHLTEENIHYGAGQLVMSIPNTQVMVIYLRGKHQKYKSNFPISKEEFFFQYEVFLPRTEKKGLKAQKDITLQIFKKLQNFENEFFSKNQ